MGSRPLRPIGLPSMSRAARRLHSLFRADAVDESPQIKNFAHLPAQSFSKRGSLRNGSHSEFN